jgi:uncharacterized membrane protein YfcA
MSILILIFLVIAAGFVGALFGVGGGVFLIPGLVLGLKMPVIEAMKISLLATLITGIVGMCRLSDWTGTVAYERALRFEPTALAGAAIGAWVSHYLPSDILMGILAIFLIVVGLMVVLKKHSEDPTEHHGKHPLRFGQIAAGAAGFSGGLLGIGGGVIMVPMLKALAHIRVKEAITISLFTMISTSSVALCAHTAATGKFWSLESLAVIFVVPAGLLGGYVRQRVRESTISIYFMLYCFLMSAIVFLRILTKG